MNNDTILCAAVGALLVASLPASATTVYDGGKALRQNCANGTPVGADGQTYTDENGGGWQYLRSNDAMAASTRSFGTFVVSGYYQGIGGSASRSGSPYIHVNTTGEATMDGVTGGEAVDADECYIHPGNPNDGYHYVVLRFIVPEDGWYSAFLSAHDLNRATDAATDLSGAEVRFLANGVLQAHGVVALEDWAGSTSCGAILTRRFDFQMPVRRMAAGDTLDFMVGANGWHYNDATGLKAFVTKEDEGRFYDAGLAMAGNVEASRINPFGTDALGMWYWFSVDASATSIAGFPAWAPGNLTKTGLSRLTVQYDRNAAMKGFRMSAEENLPYICVNDSMDKSESAPHELLTHPCADLTRWTALRFRPPRSGLYSASIAIRDLGFGSAEEHDGVMAYLLVSEKLVTNAVVMAESFNSTAHFTFDPRLVAANEPIDIVISPRNGYYSDATGISAIFRRESDVFDAGPSLAALDWSGAAMPSLPFADALGGGAVWDIGANGSAGGEFATIPYAFSKTSNGNDYFGYGVAADGGLPRVMVATNRLANLFLDTDSEFYRLVPNEIWAHPANEGIRLPVVRATVPYDGIYHARAYVRDISWNNDGIGVRPYLLSGEYVVATEVVSVDGASPQSNPHPREAAIDGNRLWLQAGDSLDAALDPNGNNWGDGTGLSVCYVRESGATPSVINIDITGASDSSGRFSAHVGRGREGWSDWNRWNALRPGGAATAERGKCMEADGVTPRNATVTLARDSGAAIAAVAGSGASTLLNNYVLSSGAADTYTFTIGELKANEPYTLWLYSAKGNAAGNALFTVDGVTKGAEGTWSLGTTKMLTRFDVVSDASGVITGTFAAADTNGGAFNGLTLVGDLPEFIPDAFTLVVR